MKTGEYRFRRGFRGTAVLQCRIDSPSFIGGHVDASIRDVQWVDVDYNRLPPLTVSLPSPPGE